MPITPHLREVARSESSVRQIESICWRVLAASCNLSFFSLVSVMSSERPFVKPFV